MINSRGGGLGSLFGLWQLAIAAALSVTVGGSGVAMPPTYRDTDPDAEAGTPLLLAFVSLRDRPAFASLYLSAHDGRSQGRLLPGPTPVPETATSHPTLSADGKWGLYTSKQVGGFGPVVRLFETRRPEAEIELALNSTFAARTEAGLSGDGEAVVFAAWDQPGEAGAWDVLQFDRRAGRLTELPGLNSDSNDREPALSSDGRWITFTSDRAGGAGRSDVYL